MEFPATRGTRIPDGPLFSGKDIGFPMARKSYQSKPFAQRQHLFQPPVGLLSESHQGGQNRQKIFVHDGGRLTFSYGANAFQPEYTLTPDPADTNQNGNMFSDLGPYDGDSHAWDRSCVPGNAGTTPTTDLRPLAFRHGTRGEFQNDSLYMLNAVFFDGHAETLASPDVSNPGLWLPTGTSITTWSAASGNSIGTTVVYKDVATRYNMLGVSTTSPWISP